MKVVSELVQPLSTLCELTGGIETPFALQQTDLVK